MNLRNEKNYFNFRAWNKLVLLFLIFKLMARFITVRDVEIRVNDLFSYAYCNGQSEAMEFHAHVELRCSSARKFYATRKNGCFSP